MYLIFQQSSWKSTDSFLPFGLLQWLYLQGDDTALRCSACLCVVVSDNRHKRLSVTFFYFSAETETELDVEVSFSEQALSYWDNNQRLKVTSSLNSPDDKLPVSHKLIEGDCKVSRGMCMLSVWECLYKMENFIKWMHPTALKVQINWSYSHIVFLAFCC